MPYKDKLMQKMYHQKWHALNRGKNLIKQKQYQLKVKLEVFNRYTDGDVKCACCGENELQFLSIDHIHGGGTKHRAEIGAHKIYFWLRNNNYPDGFRVLCHNCNQSLGFYGWCPHQTKPGGISTLASMRPSQG